MLKKSLKNGKTVVSGPAGAFEMRQQKNKV